MKKKEKGFRGNRKQGIIWYPSGWTYYEKTDTWESPNFQAQKRQEPSFEEWKAQREAQDTPETKDR